MGVRERHATGTDLQTDWHKHAVVKANRTHRWRAVTQYLENFGIFTHATAHYPAYAVALQFKYTGVEIIPEVLRDRPPAVSFLRIP